MFSALKLKGLKCQSNGNGDGNENEGCSEEDDEDGVEGHTYERLLHIDSEHYHSNLKSKASKSIFNARISQWRMECPDIGSLQNRQNVDDSYNSLRDTNTEIPKFQCHKSVRTKITSVSLEREDGNLGITLRGGFYEKSEICRPVIITYIKPDGPAAREGTIKPGDRLLAVNGMSLQGSSLAETQTLLRQPSASTLLTIEYDVNVLESVERASGPLLVEIERKGGQQLGLTLFQNENGILIEGVKPGSLADRCGALHVGDEILAVNATRVNVGCNSLDDIISALESDSSIVRLEILPISCYPNYDPWNVRDQDLSFDTFPGQSTLKEFRHWESKKNEIENGINHKANQITPHSISGTEIALTHTETLHTTLSRENGSFGIQFIDAPDGTVLIHIVSPGGPAEKSQCLYPGDRVLAINHRSTVLDNLTATDINYLLKIKSEEGSNSKLSLHTEFDVLDTVVPNSGIFTVKLVKKGSGGLGITLTASKCSGFIICEMKKGSIAHRAGSLVPGDKILAINNIPLDQCSVEYAAHILHKSPNIVTLKVQRDGNFSVLRNSRKITFTVDLERFGGPLGLTIAGSEEPFHPITISGLIPGGLADQTGVIHVGDEILAINDHFLCGQPLSKAHALLQTSSDLITLKISRSIVPVYKLENTRRPILLPSNVNAVESWNCSNLESTLSPDDQTSIRNSKDFSNQNTKNLQDNLQTNSLNADLSSNSREEADLNILDKITSENLKIKEELDLLSLKLDEKRKPKLQNYYNVKEDAANENSFEKKTEKTFVNGEIIGENPNEPQVFYADVKEANVTNELLIDERCRESFMINTLKSFEMKYLPETRNWCKNQYFGNANHSESIRSEFQCSQLYRVTLYKDPIYEDFGFSVSDGLYEKGVFINKIRKGGPADLSNDLKPYDRIIQVNETLTQDFDCCLTVPLIASAGDSLVLMVARNPENLMPDNDIFVNEKSNKDITMSTSKIGLNKHQDLTKILV